MKQLLRISIVLLLALVVIVGCGRSYINRVEAKRELKNRDFTARMEEFKNEMEIAGDELDYKLENIDELGKELDETLEDIGSDIGINMDTWGVNFGQDMAEWGKSFGEDMAKWGKNFGGDMAEFGTSLDHTLEEVFTD